MDYARMAESLQAVVNENGELRAALEKAEERIEQ